MSHQYIYVKIYLIYLKNVKYLCNILFLLKKKLITTLTILAKTSKIISNNKIKIILNKLKEIFKVKLIVSNFKLNKKINKI